MGASHARSWSPLLVLGAILWVFIAKNRQGLLKLTFEIPPQRASGGTHGTAARPSASSPRICSVQGSGFGVQGAGFRVQGAGCRGSGCRVQGSGCGVQGLTLRVPASARVGGAAFQLLSSQLGTHETVQVSAFK